MRNANQDASMFNENDNHTRHTIKTISELATHADYSLLRTLTPDPQANPNGKEHNPRQVTSGHYVPVTPTPLNSPRYVSHSKPFFETLGLSDDFAYTDEFKRLFSGDMSNLPTEMKPYGWATGYALSIYGTEYTQQCPFGNGNGYGDGRALSILEAVLNGKRWEMQLKGAGRTPYCRGADGRAVLRSSVREFLVQEHMHALGIPTSRSLSLFMSTSDTVDRPWYLEGSTSHNPEVMVENPIAISTRVAPSFIRVGQLELFGRRARCNEYPSALQELKQLVLHLIEREYADEIDSTKPFEEQLVDLTIAFRERLTSLVAHWVRVGYCQGNFNSDNCAAGGYTLDYGPFGFCELFEVDYQPWTGGGRHFSFLNQPIAAETNFTMFCRALAPLLANSPVQRDAVQQVNDTFSSVMKDKMESMWASKLGLEQYDNDLLVQLLQLMIRTGVDYTIFFRELAALPEKRETPDVSAVAISFYSPAKEELAQQWNEWLNAWYSKIKNDTSHASQHMKQVNPKFTWREWHVVPAYQEAEKGIFTRIEALQSMLAKPYEEQSDTMTATYYRLRPSSYFGAGGVSHYSCSS